MSGSEKRSYNLRQSRSRSSSIHSSNNGDVEKKTGRVSLKRKRTESNAESDSERLGLEYGKENECDKLMDGNKSAKIQEEISNHAEQSNEAIQSLRKMLNPNGGDIQINGTAFFALMNRFCDIQEEHIRTTSKLLETIMKNGGNKAIKSVQVTPHRHVDPYTKEWKADMVLNIGPKKIKLEKGTMKQISRNELRDQIVELRKDNQEWKEPSIGNIQIGEHIEEAIFPLLGRIDEPRHIGIAIGQLLFGPNFFTTKRIPTIEWGVTNKAKLAPQNDKRHKISSIETEIFKVTLLYCCGYAIEEYPNKRHHTNALRDWLNNAREGANQNGLDIREGRIKNPKNYIAHMENHIPLFERPFIKEAVKLYNQKRQAEKNKNPNKEKQIGAASNGANGFSNLRTPPSSKMTPAAVVTPSNTESVSINSSPADNAS